jgi:hypothetical protein
MSDDLAKVAEKFLEPVNDLMKRILTSARADAASIHATGRWLAELFGDSFRDDDDAVRARSPSSASPA